MEMVLLQAGASISYTWGYHPYKYVFTMQELLGKPIH